MAIDATRTLPTSPPVEREVIRIVSELVSELGTMPPSGAVTLDNSLDRDLGIGSLERVELLFRLEQAFRIRLADRVMGEADTVLDLAQAIVAAEPPASWSATRRSTSPPPAPRYPRRRAP